VYVHHAQAVGFDTVAVAVLTATRAVVFDTLMSPEAMAPVRDLLAEVAGERRTVVVNSHHHWDHVWGNAAFRDCEIVAHNACPRLMITQSRAGLRQGPAEPLEGIVLPTITFGDRLEFVDDTETVQIIHAPGHTEDSVVLYLEPERLLLAGDAAEWPLPTLAQRGGYADYMQTLRMLKGLGAHTVLPSHGPPMDASLVEANERYIGELFAAVAELKQKGAARDELALPVERFVGADLIVSDVYRRVHSENLAWAYDEV
jgi:glyoxylase-like metal-dependent hydrolase (beta-lactamase superfamily II)